MKDDSNKFDTLVDLAQSAKAIYDENQEEIDELMNRGSNVSLRERELLKDAVKKENKVVVTAEIPDVPSENVSMGYNKDDATLIIEMGEKDLNVKLPYDVILDEATMRINNGVLSVEIPREGDTEDDNEDEEE